MKTVRYFHTLAALLSVALGASGCAGGAGPETVAERFWTAVQEKDRQSVEALSIPAEDTKLNFDREGEMLTAFEVGEVRTEGDVARADTRMEVPMGNLSHEVEFETVLARRDGDWLVDLDPTGDAIMKAVLGVTMQEMGEAIGEGMKEAMQGVAEGMSDAMQEMAEGMGEAMTEMAGSMDEATKKSGGSR